MAETFKQDLPPKGGFSPVDWRRDIPKSRLGGVALLGGFAGIILFGLWNLRKTILFEHELKREKIFARIHLTPLLQAESDRRYLRDLAKKTAAEAEIMKDVPGWEVGKSVYHSGRYVIEPESKHVDYTAILDVE